MCVFVSMSVCVREGGFILSAQTLVNKLGGFSCWDLFLGLLVSLHICVLSCQYHAIFVATFLLQNLKINIMIVLSVYNFDYLVLFYILYFCIYFRIVLSRFMKNDTGIFMKTVEIYRLLTSIQSFSTVLILPLCEHELFFNFLCLQLLVQCFKVLLSSAPLVRFVPRYFLLGLLKMGPISWSFLVTML